MTVLVMVMFWREVVTVAQFHTVTGMVRVWGAIGAVLGVALVATALTAPQEIIASVRSALTLLVMIDDEVSSAMAPL